LVVTCSSFTPFSQYSFVLFCSAVFSNSD